MVTLKWCKVLAPVAAFVLVALVGCGDGVKVVKVEGKLLYKGKPVPGQRIHFKPDYGRPSWGETDAQGHFVLDYDPQNKGALVANHTVWLEPGPRNPQERELEAMGKAFMDDERRAMLKKFSEASSPIKIEVKSAQKDLVIDLEKY